MKKLKLRKDIGEEKCFDAESYSPMHTPIDVVIEWLVEAKKQGATHIQWRARTDYDGASSEVEAQAFVEYEETDEDFLARIEKEEKDKEKEELRRLKAEKTLYEKLKNKFEGGK